jgi:hypothetical protein
MWRHIMLDTRTYRQIGDERRAGGAHELRELSSEAALRRIHARQRRLVRASLLSVPRSDGLRTHDWVLGS